MGICVFFQLLGFRPFYLPNLGLPQCCKSLRALEQGVEGEVVVVYFEPLTTQNLKSSDFPEGETTWQNRRHPSTSHRMVPRYSTFAIILEIITDHCLLFAILFMQPWGLFIGVPDPRISISIHNISDKRPNDNRHG